MNRPVLATLAALMMGTAQAAPVTMNLQMVTPQGGVVREYPITLNVPTEFQVDEFFGTVEGRGFNMMALSAVLKAPARIVIRDKVKTNPDPTARQEVGFVVQNELTGAFTIYRQLRAQPLLILECKGDAQTEANFKALVQICRSVRLK